MGTGWLPSIMVLFVSDVVFNSFALVELEFWDSGVSAICCCCLAIASWCGGLWELGETMDVLPNLSTSDDRELTFSLSLYNNAFLGEFCIISQLFMPFWSCFRLHCQEIWVWDCCNHWSRKHPSVTDLVTPVCSPGIQMYMFVTVLKFWHGSALAVHLIDIQKHLGRSVVRGEAATFVVWKTGLFLQCLSTWCLVTSSRMAPPLDCFGSARINTLLHSFSSVSFNTEFLGFCDPRAGKKTFSSLLSLLGDSNFTQKISSSNETV